VKLAARRDCRVGVVFIQALGHHVERNQSRAGCLLPRRLSPLRLPRVRITTQDLKSAKMLRGAISRVVGAVLGRTIPAGDIRLMNRIAREASLARELNLAAKSLRWHHPTMAGALATIAQDAVMLLGEPAHRRRIRRCQNACCRAVFYDDSRPGLRRWCASNRCGNRMRAPSTASDIGRGPLES
jgi:predicted RNA-binding Zn ribbon-like protein